MSMTRLWAVAFFVGSLLGTGCGEVDQIFDCDEICDIQRGCVDNLDFDRCFNSCEDLSDGAADACDACLTSMTCDECTAECAGLVLEPVME